MYYGELNDRGPIYTNGHMVGIERAYDDIRDNIEHLPAFMFISRRRLMRIVDTWQMDFVDYCNQYGLCLQPEDDNG